MTRRRKRKPTRKKNIAKRITPLQKGSQAFRKGNYEEAIHAWEGIHQPARLQQAKAEAYFRLGLKQPAQALTCMQTALSLQPDKGRFAFHAALANHRAGDKLEEAVELYEKVCQSTNTFSKRAAHPLALAWLRLGEKDVVAKLQQTAVWDNLSPKQQSNIEQAQAFLQKQYDTANTPKVWQGIAAMANGRFDEAHATFTTAAKEPTTASLSHYYLGVIAAKKEETAKAAHHWSTAAQLGWQHPHLQANLGEIYHRLAEEQLATGNTQAALDAATEAYRFKEDKPLNDLIAYLQQTIAYEAANTGDWETAQLYWKLAEAQSGGNFRLICNLALAMEREEDYYEAAKLWRQALRRRPRKADHPDTISDDQVARLWQRTSVAYRRADEYEEALAVQKNAVKWQPDNLALRMELAEGYLENGRFQAAENELDRILQRNRNYIPALMLMGEVLAESGSYWYHSQPTRYWERVLEIEPNHADARQNLIHYFLERGDNYVHWGTLHGTVMEAYEKALSYDPDNGQTLTKLGYAHLLNEDEAQGQAHFDHALAKHPQDLLLYTNIIINWIAVDNTEKAWQLANQAAQTISDIPAEFYINIASNCLYNNDKELAQPWLDKAIAVAEDDSIYLLIGEMTIMVPGAEAIGEKYLQLAINKKQELGHAYMLLGVLASKQGQRREADKYWRKATKQARKEKDNDLLVRIEETKMIFSSPLSGLFSQMLGGQLNPEEMMDMLPPGLLESMFGDDDDWEDNDDDWF